MDGPENGNFSLLYVVKMSLCRWVVQKRLKTPLRNIKMAPKDVCPEFFYSCNPPGTLAPNTH